MVTQMFDDRYAPITSEIGFLECDVKIATQTYADWMRPIQAKLGVTVETCEIRGDFVTKMLALLPLTNIQCRRTLFVPTQSRWTAYFDNGWRGTDAYSAVSYLCTIIECQGIRAASVPNTIRKTAAGTRGCYGATILELYAASNEGCSFLNTKRSIFAANDGGRWQFGVHGEPLEFEELAQYEARRIRDRFTPRCSIVILVVWESTSSRRSSTTCPSPRCLSRKQDRACWHERVFARGGPRGQLSVSRQPDHRRFDCRGSGD